MWKSLWESAIFAAFCVTVWVKYFSLYYNALINFSIDFHLFVRQKVIERHLKKKKNRKRLVTGARQKSSKENIQPWDRETNKIDYCNKMNNKKKKKELGFLITKGWDKISIID